MKNAKFKVGDLILLSHENTAFFDYNDYGIIYKIEDAGKDFDEIFHYHIHWAIDQESTIEDDRWVHKNIKLVERA